MLPDTQLNVTTSIGHKFQVLVLKKIEKQTHQVTRITFKNFVLSHVMMITYTNGTWYNYVFTRFILV